MLAALNDSPRGTAALPQYDDLIRTRLQEERHRLLADAGLQSQAYHFKRPVERPFTRADRERVTVLIGGLSVRPRSARAGGAAGPRLPGRSDSPYHARLISRLGKNLAIMGSAIPPTSRWVRW